ncbi:uncharacterized protein [Typha latifolia]|uniref:uncharacterized protein n=1 Tax=Typha latifolia TaxID=4733 RepID=UPI003C2E8F9B
MAQGGEVARHHLRRRWRRLSAPPPQDRFQRGGPPPHASEICAAVASAREHVVRQRMVQQRRRGGGGGGEEGGVDGFYEELSTGSSDNVRMGRSGIGATEEEEEEEDMEAEEDKVGGSFAVVKRSEDPRGDFRRSMAEMVVEKEIYDSAGLERLLQCFLSLNARHHHKAIVDAFGDIWDAIFPTSATPPALLPKYLLK